MFNVVERLAAASSSRRSRSIKRYLIHSAESDGSIVDIYCGLTVCRQMSQDHWVDSYILDPPMTQSRSAYVYVNGRRCKTRVGKLLLGRRTLLLLA